MPFHDTLPVSASWPYPYAGAFFPSFFFLDLLEKTIRHFLMSPRQASAAVGAIAVGPLLELLVSCAGFIDSLLALRVMGSFFAVKRGLV